MWFIAPAIFLALCACAIVGIIFWYIKRKKKQEKERTKRQTESTAEIDAALVNLDWTNPDHRNKLNALWDEFAGDVRVRDKMLDRLIPANIQAARRELSIYFGVMEKPFTDWVWELLAAPAVKATNPTPDAIKYLTSAERKDLMGRVFKAYGYNGLDLSAGACSNTSVGNFAQLVIIYSVSPDKELLDYLRKDNAWKNIKEMNVYLDNAKEEGQNFSAKMNNSDAIKNRKAADGVKREQMREQMEINRKEYEREREKKHIEEVMKSQAINGRCGNKYACISCEIYGSCTKACKV